MTSLKDSKEAISNIWKSWTYFLNKDKKIKNKNLHCKTSKFSSFASLKI